MVTKRIFAVGAVLAAALGFGGCALDKKNTPMQKGPSGPTLSDLLGSSTALPEATAAKKGGAFDTLNGNALQR